MTIPRKKPLTENGRKTAAVTLRLHPASDPHLEAMHVSSLLTQNCRRLFQPDAAMITVEEVIELLNRAKVKFVLMGNYGVGTWRDEPRATQDVDVLVQRSHLPKAVKAIQRAFPHLAIEDYPPVTRFIDPGTKKSVVDVMKPVDAIYQAVFRNTVQVGDTHLIPNLEMGLVSKFAAMTSPNRAQDKKYIDAADFINIVKTNASAIELDKLRRLANKVYPEGGKEILNLVSNIRAGRPIQI